ncbi:Ger(x)C family spore germination C-terminal domain-containing protein [Clostridium sporogenes]|uniref:Ger(x)C family spore germination C-terminal domain-containing protein n=2 Tax=Clostridium sporogenes TaxID=1509 RepID=UPI0013D73890|nr:Ger(x)C family spore germination C-terminal domain-containing protein [Clostridium sporogenes]MCW6087808.1 spore gernimation protein [Clostridium sporogenes]NFF69177.1 spore gernimation protein [Clostridium sporogenes]NFF97864.1 spore gernimation protein [Clostridium sporogenes]NFG08060.1 spore gernimation protein [Clostridium sporogenes]NFG50142.1 spore gernimation protein [Clostridium sporogenes]
MKKFTQKLGKKLNHNRINIIIAIIIILNIYYYNPNIKYAEELDIPAGIGYDFQTKIDNIRYYKIPISTYIFKPNNTITSIVHEGKGETLLKTRQYRQRGSNRKFLLGNEKVYLISEKSAYDGVNEIVNLLFFNPLANPQAFTLVCSGSPKDILNYKIEGYPNSADYIYGLMKNSPQYNFFPVKAYTTNINYYQLKTEGKSLVLPYIEAKKDGIEITGMAIFKGDKMERKISVDEMQTLNMLREKKSKGIISIQKSYNNFGEMDCYITRKVECYKEKDKYKFVIKLDIKGDMINCKSCKKELCSKEGKDGIVKEFEQKIYEESYEFINKMQNEYKIDVLNLGSVAAAKYGRHTGVDWNKAVSDSEIQLDINMRLIRGSRGTF